MHPLCLPYRVQHLLLTKVQLLLEECCYDFACLWLPDVVERENCDCAVAIELNTWTHLICKNAHQIPSEAFDSDGRELTHTLAAADRLRHCAVHRTKLSGDDLQRQVGAALELASLFKDSERAALLRAISYELDSRFTFMKRMKQSVESMAVDRLRQLQRVRRGLDREEKAIFGAMSMQDNELATSLGGLIEEHIGKLFAAPLELEGAPDKGKGRKVDSVDRRDSDSSDDDDNDERYDSMSGASIEMAEGFLDDW